MQKISQPLPLTGAKNVRDLGGYRTEDGMVTKTHSFLRGDALHNLTDDDCRVLYEYAVRCIIDLRSHDETSRECGRLHRQYSQIEYVHIPIQDHVRAVRYSGEFPPSMRELYCWLLDDSGDSFRQVFETIGRHREHCILFHCSGGKDRTGMVAMLLLKLAGVDDETVIGDYALSETSMKDIFAIQTAQMEARGLVVPPYIMQSPPENMICALEHLHTVYKTARDYLLHLGFSESQIEDMRRKLVE